MATEVACLKCYPKCSLTCRSALLVLSRTGRLQNLPAQSPHNIAAAAQARARLRRTGLYVSASARHTRHTQGLKCCCDSAAGAFGVVSAHAVSSDGFCMTVGQRVANYNPNWWATVAFSARLCCSDRTPDPCPAAARKPARCCPGDSTRQNCAKWRAESEQSNGAAHVVHRRAGEARRITRPSRSAATRECTATAQRIWSIEALSRWAHEATAVQRGD